MIITMQAEVKATGKLSCIDSEGARPLTPEEFHGVVGRMADHLDDEGNITDPSVWGQASSGDMEIYFILPVAAGTPALNEQIAGIIRRMGDAIGLIWANDPSPPVRNGVAPMLDQKSQHWDLISVPA